MQHVLMAEMLSLQDYVYTHIMKLKISNGLGLLFFIYSIIYHFVRLVLFKCDV